MEKATERADKTPKIVMTDKLAAYLDGIELAYGADAEHRQGSPFDVQNPKPTPPKLPVLRRGEVFAGHGVMSKHYFRGAKRRRLA